jgi:hypothetical protein
MANILEAGDRADERATAIAALRAKYAQYVSHHLETRPIIRIEIERTTSWGALALR